MQYWDRLSGPIKLVKDARSIFVPGKSLPYNYQQIHINLLENK